VTGIKLIKKLATLICDDASFGGILILLQSSLVGILSYYMSMLLLNKNFVEKLAKHMRSFFWQCKKIRGNIIWLS
jgi:uncharacterized membrane-anchored protein